jgi:hypothetical protein
MTPVGILRVSVTPEDRITEAKVIELWHFENKIVSGSYWPLQEIVFEWNIVSTLCKFVDHAVFMCFNVNDMYISNLTMSMSKTAEVKIRKRRTCI